MSISITTQAQNMYNSYTFKNSKTYSENAVDSSEVSKDKYNVSNLTNALDAMTKADSINIGTISNIDFYVNNTYKLSQMDSYDSISSAASSISDILTGEASANDIYSLLETEKELKAETALSAVSSSTNAAVTAYCNYISESGSMLNLLA